MESNHQSRPSQGYGIAGPGPDPPGGGPGSRGGGAGGGPNGLGAGVGGGVSHVVPDCKAIATPLHPHVKPNPSSSYIKLS